MKIEVRWLDDAESILVETFPKKWDMQDYWDLVNRANSMIEQKDYLVDLIVDFTLSGRLPINVMAGMSYAEKQVPDNQGLVVLVNSNGIVNMFVNISQDLKMNITSNVLLADSIDNAHQMIKEQRQLSDK